ncbi:MAG TPA: sigma 54-interacting transcriptional regulator [Nitrospirota bacterium]
MKKASLPDRRTDTQAGSPASLRRKAEEKLRTQLERLKDLSARDIQELVHELGTHQIELEMQNEELSKARDELETSRNQYAELYDFAPVGYFTIDAHGLIEGVNLTGARLLGIERGLLLKRPFISIIAEAADREIFSKHCSEVFKKQGNQTCEIRLKRKDGSLFYAQLQSAAKVNIDDKAGIICTTITDITDRRKIDEANKFQADALSQVNDAVVAIDNANRIIYWNKAAERQYNRKAADVIGCLLNEAYSAKWINADDERAALESLKSTGTWRGENIHVKKNGEEIYVLSSVSVLKDKFGVPVGMLAVIGDITGRRRIEDSLQKAYAELDLRIQERTGELSRANEQLSQEIEERKGTEESLRSLNAENKQLKERFQAENIYLHKIIEKEYNFGEIIGRSNALEYVFFRVEQVAPQDATVLLLGETGTGKGVIARAIHSRSTRKDRPMITVNCSALPANLIESELFGREKGAFTGSHDRQMGRFELADNSTLFLDEIGEMPMDLQTKLLRVIQDGEFERLGGPKTIKVNVRIIASTNRKLEEEIRKGRFREDLFYRLNVFPITIPPLRQRKEDIPLLVDYFVAKFNKKTGKKIETVTKDTLKVLQEYDWPGNVRELESIVERAVITSQGTALQILDRFVNSLTTGGQGSRHSRALVDMERDHIVQALENCGWRIEGEKGAAAMLGLNPSTLRGRMRKDGIRRS